MKLRWALVCFLMGCVALPVAAQFKTSKEPVTPDGNRAAADIPLTQTMRNTGGMGPGGPGTGFGLCVWTSMEVAARWQNVVDLYGLQKWMTTKEGGGYPEKVDDYLPRFCREKGVPVPAYAQHEGGDVDFLKLALKTDRMVGVTYCGADSVHYSETIAHMLNLIGLDDNWAVLIDNNYNQEVLILPADEFIARWRGVKKNGSNYLIRTNRGWQAVGGGWAIVLLDSPPPSSLPERVSFGQNCVNGRCGIPQSSSSYPTLTFPSGASWVPNENGKEWGYYKDGKCIARLFADGHCESADQNGNATGHSIPPPAPIPVTFRPDAATAPAPDFDPNFGVDSTKLRNSQMFSINGRLCTKADYVEAIRGVLNDDTEKWHLTVVGADNFLTLVKGQIVGLPVATKNKLHVQYYPLDHWAVSKFSLPSGVSLRRPSPGRVSEQVGVVATGDFTLEQLLKLLEWLAGDPKPKSPEPAPTPTPVPQPSPAPTPSPSTPSWPLWVVIALAALYFLLPKKAN